MTSKLRLALPMAVSGVVGATCFLLLQSHASARVTMNYAHLTKYQKRIISETLASAIGPQSTGLSAHAVVGNDDQGGGPDGAPFTPPTSYQPASSGGGSTINYFPSSGGCSANIGKTQRSIKTALTSPILPSRVAARPTTSHRFRSIRSIRSSS